MLDVKNSLANVGNTVQHHYLHIKNQHPFMRAWAVQFEVAYTDFRIVQVAIQLSGAENHDLLRDFSLTYEAIYKYEYAFAAGGLEGFNDQFGNEIDDYGKLVDKFAGLVDQVTALQQKGESTDDK